MKSMLITPGEGLGEIRLGMTPAEVSRRMNEDELYEEWMGGNLNDCLCFHGLLFCFRECDSRSPLPHSPLYEITIGEREGVEICGRPLSDWTAEDLASALKSSGYEVFRWTWGIDIPGKLHVRFATAGHPVAASITNVPVRRKGSTAAEK